MRGHRRGIRYRQVARKSENVADEVDVVPVEDATLRRRVVICFGLRTRTAPRAHPIVGHGRNGFETRHTTTITPTSLSVLALNQRAKDNSRSTQAPTALPKENASPSSSAARTPTRRISSPRRSGTDRNGSREGNLACVGDAPAGGATTGPGGWRSGSVGIEGEVCAHGQLAHQDMRLGQLPMHQISGGAGVTGLHRCDEIGVIVPHRGEDCRGVRERR